MGTERVKYVKRRGVSDSLGEDYEIGMAALLFLRGLNYTSDFFLASNHAMAGDFDDLVFIYRIRETEPWKAYFMQLKHKNNNSMHKKSALVRLSKKNEFSVPGYFPSYPKVVQNLHAFENETGCALTPDHVSFVLYTNAMFNGDLEEDDEESILSTDGFEINLNGDEHKDLFELIEELPTYRTLLESLASETNFEVAEGKIRNQRTINHFELVSRLKRLCNQATYVEELKKLSEEVREMADVTEFTKFVDALNFLCGQSHQEDLHIYIKIEILSALSVLAANAQFVYRNLIQLIKSWWKDGESYLTKYSSVWKDILELHVNNILGQVNHLPVLEFNATGMVQLNSYMEEKKAFAVISDGSNVISVSKVLQYLKGAKYFTVTTTSLIKRLDAVLSIWVSYWYDILVVDLAAIPETTNIKCLCNKLCSVLKFAKGKKLVMIADSVVSSVFDAFRNLFHSEWGVLLDKNRLSDLGEQCRASLLSTSLHFQGKCITYQQLMTMEPSLEYFFDGKRIKHILEHNDSIKIGKDLVCEDKIYVKRTLSRRCYVSETYFEKLRNPSCIAISGLTVQQLVTMLDGRMVILDFCEIVEWRHEADRYKFIFVVLGTEDPSSEFETLCEEFGSRNLHWFRWQNKRWKWHQSKTSINTIRKYLINFEDSYCEDDIINSTEKVIPIVGASGLGKSFFVKKIAEIVKNNNPCLWVIILEFSQLKHYMEVTHENLVRVLCKVSGIADDDEFGTALLTFCYFEAKNVIILLDGADEMNPSLRDQTIQISNMMIKNVNISKVIITSRPNSNLKLERVSNSFSYHLQSFGENDLADFFKLYWNREAKDCSRVEDFVSNSLKLARSFEICKRDCFISIPLHAYMLVESIKANCTSGHSLGEIQNFDIIQLYQSFFDTKISLSLNGILNTTNLRADTVLKRLRESYLNSHMYLALRAIFSSSQISSVICTENLKQNIDDAIHEIENEHERTGIIQSINNGVPQFAHRSFAEYLAAVWLSKNYSQNKDLLQAVQLQKHFNLVSDIFNKIMCRDFPTHKAIINDVSDFSSESDINKKDWGGRTPLHIAVIYNKTSIFESLINAGALLDELDYVLEWSPLRYADALSRWEIVDLILRKGCHPTDIISLESKTRNVQDRRELMREFAASGHLKLLQYVTKDESSLLDVVEGRHFSVVHVAAHHGQLEVVKYIYKRSKMEDESAGQIFTICKPLPLLAAVHSALHGGHLEIVKYLMGKENCVNIRNEFRRLPIHCACLIKVAGSAALVDAQVVMDLIRSLIEMGSNLDAKDMFGLTPLHCCVYRENVAAMKLLVDSGADVNAQDGRCFTALHIAVNKRDIDSHKRPMMPYLNEDNKGKPKGKADGQVGESTALVSFLLEAGVNVNAKDCDDNTALHIAAWSGYLEAVEKLVAAGADPRAEGRRRRTPLHVAAQWASPELVALLLSACSDVHSRDEGDETPLDIARRQGNLAVEQLLL